MFEMKQVTDATNKSVLNRRIKNICEILTATEREARSIARECKVFGIDYDMMHGSIRIFKDHALVHTIEVEGE